MRIKLLPLPYYAPDDEGKSSAQLERDKIKVTSNITQKADEDEASKAADATDDNNTDDESDTENENSLGEGNKGEEEESQETEEGTESEEDGEEQTKELTSEQKELEALKRKIERLQKRVGRTVGERDDIKKELRDTKAALEAKVADGTQALTEEEVNRRAQNIANQELSVREFNRAQEKLVDEATKLDKDFMKKINDVAANVSPIPPFIIEALNDLDNGGAVLNHFANNEDDYEEIVTMIAERKSPIKVLGKLNKLSEKLIQDAKPKPKKISNAPNPPKAPGGNTKTPDTLPQKPTDNMKEFVRVRNKQIEEKRKAKFG